MLFALALLFQLRAEVPQNLQVRPELSRTCARYLTRLDQLSRSRADDQGLETYLRASRAFVLGARRKPTELEKRRDLFDANSAGWQARVAGRLVELDLIPSVTKRPWRIKRTALLAAFPHFEHFLPRGYQFIYDPFYLIEKNILAEHQKEPRALTLPVELLEPEKRNEVASTLAHEFVHVKMENHPLSRFIHVRDDLPFPRFMPAPYADGLSSEELFAFTVDLLNRWRLEGRGIRFKRDSNHKERALRGIISYYLETLYPLMRDDAWMGNYLTEGEYSFGQAPISVALRVDDQRRTMRRDLKAQLERIAEAARDLRTRLDSNGDRVALLTEFLVKHGLDPADFLL